MAKRRDESSSTNPAGPHPTVSDQIERELAAAAVEKRRAGLRPTSSELAALRRFEKRRDEQQRWAIYRSIPKKHWREMSGRQAKVINEQAAAYGIPFGGPVIDLQGVVRALHDFLARNKRRLAAGNGEPDPLLSGENSPALERYRLARAKREELAYERDLMAWVSAERVREALGVMATVMRSGGERLQRQYGVGVQDHLNEIIDQAVDGAVRCLGDGGDDQQNGGSAGG